MGLPVARHQDICTGHGCWPPRPNATASRNVFVNSRGAHRQTDMWESHCCGLECHPGSTARGSSTVYVNSLQLARIQDPVDCGSAIMTGSHNVYAGG